jgi:hypothetical protein
MALKILQIVNSCKYSSDFFRLTNGKTISFFH